MGPIRGEYVGLIRRAIYLSWGQVGLLWIFRSFESPLGKHKQSNNVTLVDLLWSVSATEVSKVSRGSYYLSVHSIELEL